MKKDVRKEILRQLLYNNTMSYNKLWNKSCTSSLFDYHLKKLLDEELLMKQGSNYRLTPKGSQYISSLDGMTIEQKPKPLVCCFVLGINDDGEYLFQRRKKQPFMDYVGLPGGKLEVGLRLEEQAAKEFLEETGLRAKKYELSTIVNYITYEQDTVSHQMIGFFFIATGLHGRLIKTTREGENFFIHKKDISKHKLFPDLKIRLPEMLKPKKYLIIKEAKRYIKDGEFIGIEFFNMN